MLAHCLGLSVPGLSRRILRQLHLRQLNLPANGMDRPGMHAHILMYCSIKRGRNQISIFVKMWSVTESLSQLQSSCLSCVFIISRCWPNASNVSHGLSHHSAGILCMTKHFLSRKSLSYRRLRMFQKSRFHKPVSLCRSWPIAKQKQKQSCFGEFRTRHRRYLTTVQPSPLANRKRPIACV